jgi:hypothetical protein
MFNNDDALERVAQLERLQKLGEKRETVKQRKISIARRIKIGEMVEAAFPEVLKFQPKFRKEEAALEFAALENFLTTLAADTVLIEQLKVRSKGE